jgi:hypothetical protein
MADNVIKFRKIEKRPEPKKPDPKKPAGGPPNWPTWLPWAVIGAAGVVFFLLQQSGVIGG